MIYIGSRPVWDDVNRFGRVGLRFKKEGPWPLNFEVVTQLGTSHRYSSCSTLSPMRDAPRRFTQSVSGVLKMIRNLMLHKPISTCTGNFTSIRELIHDCLLESFIGTHWFQVSTYTYLVRNKISLNTQIVKYEINNLIHAH